VLGACGWDFLAIKAIKSAEIEMNTNCYAKTIKKVTGQPPLNAGILDGVMGVGVMG
jgi:hypothetical protein